MPEYTIFTEEMKSTHTILVPNMLPMHFKMMIRIFHSYGYNCELLETTGGIVQGMSGSPILQNGKLVGAVTHVLINDPTSGYGIFIENMLNATNITVIVDSNDEVNIKQDIIDDISIRVFGRRFRIEPIISVF